MTWRPFDKIGVAVFNFDGQNEHHLSLRVGDLLYLMEEYPGWYRGHLYQNPAVKGIFPASHVETKEHTTEKIGQTTHIIPYEDKVALEANEALREWREKLIQYYLRGDKNHFRSLLFNMEDVLSWRRKLLHSNVTHDAVQDMRTRLSYKIDSVNNEFHCPLTPRDNKGEIINCHECSAQQLYHVHQDRKAELEVGVIQTGALQRRATRSSSIHNHHLYLVVNKIDHQFPEDVEVFFFLYDTEDKGRQVSERYLIRQGKGQGHRGHRGHDDKMSALFTDLGSKDIQASGMHLICQIIRRGKMLPDDKKNVSQFPFRRPYACGVLEVATVLQDAEKAANTLHEEDLLKSFSMPLYVCSANHESDFATFHLSVIKRTAGKGGQKPGCAINLSLKAFHGDLAQLRRDFPITLTQTMAVVHKLGFPDVILPGDVRNDIYVTLEHGQFEKGSKRAERNVEVAIEVIDGKGKTIPRAILVAAGAEPISEYESFIFYHNNTPKWSETFKLCIPSEQLPECHLRICFRHVAKNESKEKAEKTFAFTYMNIMKDDGSIIKDGIHEFYVYKAEGKHWHNPKVYLMQVSCKDDIVQQRSSKTFATPTSKSDVASAATSISRSFRETIHLSTLTCSTKLTQKIEILMLLKWRQKEQNLGVVLTNLSHISGEEVVKFLQDTLDCLFEILNTNSDIYGEKVFDVLVSIFGQLQDDKYQHFNTVLDIYITKHFSAVLAYKFLVWCFEKHVREYGHQPEMHLKLEKVFKSMRYLFRFMVQSHSLQVRNKKQEDPAFKSELRQVFLTFSQLMTYQENKVKQVYKVQSVLLANLPAVLPDVVQVLPETDVATMISHVLESMRNTYGTLPRDKLKFMLAVLDCDVKLLWSQDARSFLVPSFVKQVVSHIDQQMPRTNYKPEDRSNVDCMTVIGRLVETLAEPQLGVTDDDIEFLSPLIHPLMRLHKVLTPNNPLVPSSLINLIGVLDLMKDIHFATFFRAEKSATDNSFKDFIQDFMVTLTVVLRKIKLFHEDWVTMYLVQCRVVSKTIQNISKALIDGFLATKDFNPLIWDKYFALCKDFITLPCLQLERYSMYRTRLYQLQFGDLRVKLGKHVVVMWHRLGEKKANFIPGLIGPYLEITLLKCRQLRTIALPVVVDMMSCEQQASGNFKRVETEVFDKIDNLLFNLKGDEEYKEMFHDILNAECCRRKNLSDSGPAFIDSVSRLIGLLLDYRNVSTDESYRARRMGCMFNLLNFYKEIDKQELYIRYIYKLAELHQHNQNYTEAGFTLLLHTKGLEWSDEEEVPAGGRFPAQSSLNRREELYMEAIRLFDEGKSWECGIPLCKELAKLYETELFDYQKLAAILRREAEFFQKIIRELRVEPEFFMVGYYGKGFPLFLRNKVFIHRGMPYERLGSFIKRLTDEFSTAEILKTTTPPDNDIQSSSGMYLQVRSVQPIEERPEHLKGKRVPEKVTEYYKTNEVQRFRYDRPFHKGQKNKECEFASMWIERTTFMTSNSFPGVISWFEVTDTDAIELNPLDIAVETMNSKNRDIQTMTGQYQADKSLNINPLSMLLNGVIDAAVMGGVTNYEKIFFAESYLKENPSHATGVKQLRQLIEEQTYLLEKALHVHAARVEPSLQAFHSKLESCFEDFQCIVFPEKRQQKSTPQRRPMRSATIARPLPPTPFGPQGAGGGSPPSSLRAKQINRRATGVPGRMKLPSFYEQTDPDPGDRQRHPAKRSASNVSSFHPPPVQPPPILSANPTSPGSKRRLSTDPEAALPTPPSQNALSAISTATTTTPTAASTAGGSNNENMALAPPSEEKRSRESSRQSSVNRLSGVSEDEEMGNYEPIDGYLVDKQKSESIKVPGPQRSVESSPKSQSLSQRSSMSDAPHYPAPLPPGAPSQQQENNTSTLKDAGDEDDEDSDGYEPVQLAGQEDETDSRFRDDVERAVLPLKPGAMRVGQGQPQLQPRSRERSPSYTGTHPSAGLRHFGRERSPTVVQNTTRVMSESPPATGILSSSVPLGASHLIRPPIKEKSASPPTKVVMPPEPSSPPPSPPIGRRDVTSPSGGRPIPAQRQKSPSPPAYPPGQQPTLPPKKKSARNPGYESHILPNQLANDDEGIYSFDRLSPPPPPAGVAKATTGSPRRIPSPSNAPVTLATGEQQDEVYFDHLVSGPPIPQKSAIPPHRTDLTNQMSQPEGADEDNVYFDHLSSGPPPPSSNVPPSIPKKSAKPSEQPIQQDDVYFDHLTSGPPPPSHPPNLPRKPSPASEQQPTIQQDDVYFDHLVSGPPPTVPGKMVQASVPEPQQGGGGGGEEEDQVYFDHLTSPPPVKPSQSVSAPKLPPRRPSSVSSDMKPSNGVKKPPPIPQSPKKPEIRSKAPAYPPPPVSPTQGASKSPTSPNNPPPLPIKKRLTVKRQSESTDGAADLGSSPGHSSRGHTLPVPRLRTSTSSSPPGGSDGPSPPVLPPKPAIPGIPPRPSGIDKPAPPLPSKPKIQWPPPKR